MHMESGVLRVTLRANIKYFINANNGQPRHKFGYISKR